MRKIIVTGAAGNIGAKVAPHLRSTGRYEVLGLDIKAGEGIAPADFSVYDPAWVRLFEGVDTIIHLAADPRGQCSWAEVMGPNVMGTQHVLRAAREHRLRRVVFASSVQVVMGYRFRGEGRITTDMPPQCLSPYAIAKLFGEYMGRGFAEETGISFIAFRIGYFQRGENLPGPHMGIGTFGQSMWLSNHDMNQAMEAAIEAENVPYAVLNLESDNPGMRFDIEHTKRTIGYAPRDGHTPVITREVIADDETSRTIVGPPGTWYDEHFHEVAK